MITGLTTNLVTGLTSSLGGGAGGASPVDLTTLDSALMYFRADNPDNVLVTYSDTFTSSDVNTTNNTIALSITNFTRSNPYEFGLFYFSTTGTLPAPFIANTPYIGLNDGSGNYSFYPYGDQVDYTDFPDYQASEKILAGLSFSYLRNKINITSGGSGTHTITTKPLLKDLHDLVSDTIILSKSESGKAGMFEVLDEGIHLAGGTGFDSNFVEPQGKFLSDTLEGLDLGAIFAGKRYLYSVCKGTPIEDHYASQARAVMSPSAVNAGTGALFSINHGFQTGFVVSYGAMSDDGVFPTPDSAFADPLYVRRIDNNYFSLHDSASDASTNTSPHTYSDTGTGLFYVSGGGGIKSSASNRKMVFDVSMQSNDHSFCPAFYDERRDISLSSGATFMPTGFGDGNLNFLFTPTDFPADAWSILKVTIIIPDGATTPTPTDGLGFASGTFYMTQEVGSPWRRLHRTLANAQACVGVATNSCSNTNLMKYNNTLGTGNGWVYVREKFILQQFDDSFVQSSTNVDALATYGETGVYVHLVDYDSGGGKWLYYTGKDVLWNFIEAGTGTKNSPLPAASTNSSLFLGNTGQPHVPGSMFVKSIFIGGSDTDPTADIETVLATLAAEVEPNNLLTGAIGDSTAERLFTQFSGAGEAAYETQAANYYDGTINYYDAANSGTYLLETTALLNNVSNTNIFWVDDSGVLAKGNQFTNNITNDSNSPDCYNCSLGINDNAYIVTGSITASDIEDAFDFIADTAVSEKSIEFMMLNPLGRDAGGDNAGCNIIREGIYNAIANNANIKRGVDTYDLERADNKHLVQAGDEAKGVREAIQNAYYLGETTTQALGAKVTAASLVVDEITLTLTHVGGTDITAPSSGNGGMDATDDGTAMGATALTRIDNTHAKLTFPEGKAPVYSSAVKVYVPYGRDGGLAANPDVMRDNSTLTLPIQSDIITVTDDNPIMALDNVISYWDARGSAKTLTSTEVEAIAALKGTGLVEVDAGDHAVWDSVNNLVKYQSLTQLLYTSAFTATETQTFVCYFKHPATLGSGDILFFANSGSGTDNQAKLTFSGGKFIYSNNEAAGSEIISDTQIDAQSSVMILEFVDASICNVYWNGESSPSFTFDPVADYSAWTYILLGARTAGSENGAYADLGIYSYLHTSDILTSQEKSDIFETLTTRFGEPT